MKKRFLIILAAALIGIMAAQGALAQPVRFAEGSPAFLATGSDGTERTLQADALQILAKTEEGTYLVYASGAYYTVKASELGRILPDVDLAALPNAADYTPFILYAEGDAVLAMQEALAQLGYLNGAQDGVFGRGTAQAIRNFQTDQGAPATGDGSVNTQLHILSATQEAVEVGAAAQGAHPAMESLSGVDLEALGANGLTVDYDDISGTGLIYDGKSIQYDASGAADIDEAQFTVRIGLYVRETEDGQAVAPAALLDCLCVRRPMMTELTLKSGTERCTVAEPVLTSELSGARSIEHAVFFLDDAAVAILRGAQDAGELKLRVGGKYQSFDIVVPLENLEGISAIGRVASGIAG